MNCAAVTNNMMQKRRQSLITDEKKRIVSSILTFFYYLCRVINIPIMKIYPLLILLLTVGLSACSDKKPTGKMDEMLDTIPEMVMRIQKSSRLYTTEYYIHKIVTHDDTKKLTGSFMSKNFSIDLPMGQRKIAIPMDATVRAYIDFSTFSEKNVNRNGDKVEIILPDPKIVLTGTRINHAEVKQYVPLFRRRFSDAELTNYERQGRQAILNDLPKLNLIEQSKASAARTLIPFITEMGFKQEDVTITFRKRFTPSDIATLIEKSTLEHETAGK